MNNKFPPQVNYDQGLLERMLRLIVRKQELLGPENYRMRARYTVALGSIEAELRLLDLQVQRLKRRIQLMEAFVGQYSPEQDEQIEQVLAQEFYETETELLDDMRQVDQARDFLRGPIMKAGTDELTEAFREMVYKLHPVFHPDQTEVQQELLSEVYEAYAVSDWDGLRELHETIKTMPEPQRPMPNLIKQIYALEEEIEQIWEEFPYNQRDLLQDDVKLAERQADVYARIKAKREELSAWTNRYTMLIENRQAGHLIN